MKSAKATVTPFPNARTRRDRDEIAFLPAALEIVETPPSPIGRAIGVTIIALFCLALAWAAFGKIDIVASAPGKIIAGGRTKTIQPFETGVVRSIHVRDGTSVKAGDVLIELDPTMNLAERNHLHSDLVGAQLDIARLKAALSEGDDPLANFHPPQEATPAQIAMQRQFLNQPNSGAPRQSRRARSPKGPEGSRARHHCCDYRQARGDHHSSPTTGGHSIHALQQTIRFQADIS
jgi:hemolysin D